MRIYPCKCNNCFVVSPDECVQDACPEKDGDYQYCSDCRYYVSCASGVGTKMPCPGGLVWDDSKKSKHLFAMSNKNIQNAVGL